MIRRLPWGIIGAVVFVIGLFVLGVIRAGPFRGRTTREIALSCTTDLATRFHIHPSLQIMINGQEKILPTNIGVKPGCMNPLHTHDSSGRIHIESPVERDFTLGDFFAVWSQTFDRNQILESRVDASHRLRMIVNGQDSDQYDNLVFSDDQQIVISYEEIPI